jgi:hypothetical protein
MDVPNKHRFPPQRETTPGFPPRSFGGKSPTSLADS